MTEGVLTAKDLSIGYRHRRRPDTVVGRGLDIHVSDGEIVCLIGPNGVGKSTLIRTLAGLQPPLNGEVFVEEQALSSIDPRERAQSIGIVLTERVDVGMLTAFALVSLGRHPYTDWTGRLTEIDVKATRWALAAVGATDLTERFVGELSDGERQKVMIARALAQEPHVIILDEPTAYLDLPRRVEILGVLRDLAHDTNRAILLSTHDLDLAIRTADRLWLMGRSGSVQVGAPEDLVLTGALEEAFEEEGVVFDRDHGSFVLANGSARTVTLSGQGTTATWTARALQRVGYRISENGGNTGIHVDVIESSDGNRWRTIHAGNETVHRSLHDLLLFLRSLQR